MRPTVSRELALVIASMDGGSAVIQEGVTGKGFPPELQHLQTEVLGNVQFERRCATFLADRSADHKNLHARVASVLLSTGFTLPEPRERTGFTSSPTAEHFGFNREDCSIIMVQRNAPNGGSVVSVSVGPPIPVAQRELMARMHRRPNLPIPLLSEPAGVEQHSTGGGGSGSSQNTHAMLVSSDKRAVNVAAVSAHHQGDLVSQGWRQIGHDIGPEYVIASYVLQETSGKTYAGLYSITQLAKKSQAGLQFTLSSLRGEHEFDMSSWAAF